MEDVDNNSVGSQSNDARDATGNKNPPALLIESQSASSFTASPTQDHMTITDADLPAFMSPYPASPLHMPFASSEENTPVATSGTATRIQEAIEEADFGTTTSSSVDSAYSTASASSNRHEQSQTKITDAGDGSPSDSGDSTVLLERPAPHQFRSFDTPSTRLRDGGAVGGTLRQNHQIGTDTPGSPMTDFRDDIRAISATFASGHTRLNAEVSALKNSLSSFTAADAQLSPLMMKKMIDSDDDDDDEDDKKSGTMEGTEAGGDTVQDDRQARMAGEGAATHSDDAGDAGIGRRDSRTSTPKAGKADSLNSILRDNGFASIDPAGLSGDALETFKDVLDQYCRRGKLVRELLETTKLSVQKESQADSENRKLRSKHDALRRELDRLKNAQERERPASRAAERKSASAAGGERDVSDLTAKCKQMEHELRVKDREIDKLRARLHDKVMDEEKRGQRDRKAYVRIKAVLNAKEKGLMSASNIRDLKVMDVVSMYETQQELMEADMGALRREVRSLSKELRDKENYIIRKDQGGGWRTPHEGELSQQIALARNQLASSAAELLSQQQSAAKSIQERERLRAGAEKKAEVLAEANANLLLELEARPSKKLYNNALDKIDRLESKLRAYALAGDDVDANAAPADVEEAFDVGFQHLRTSDKIARDRDVHRLGLHSVADLPRDVLIKVLQDVCIKFEIRDVRVLPIAVVRCLKVVAAIPQLEKFVTDVCEVVFDQEGGHETDGAGGERSGGAPAMLNNPMAVPILLKNWRMQLHERALLVDMRESVLGMLDRRCDGAIDPELSGTTVAIVHAIDQLVEREAKYLLLQSRLADAEAVLASNPDDFFVKLVQHFQNIFCEPGSHVEGVLPAMNHLYNSLAEVNNMMRWLRTVLGMEDDASTNAVAKRLQSVFSAAREMTQHAASGEGAHAGGP